MASGSQFNVVDQIKGSKRALKGRLGEAIEKHKDTCDKQGPQPQPSCISFRQLYEELISFSQARVNEEYQQDDDLLHVMLQSRVNMMAQKDCFYFACKALDLNKELVDSLPQQYVSCLPALPEAEIEYERMGAEENDAIDLATTYRISPLISFNFSPGTAILFLSQFDDQRQYPWVLFHYLGPNTKREDETVGHWFKGSVNITGVQSFYSMQESDRVLEDEALQKLRIKKARVGNVCTTDLSMALLPPFQMQPVRCAKSSGLCRMVPAEQLHQLQQNTNLKTLFPHLWEKDAQLKLRQGAFDVSLDAKTRAQWKKMTPSRMSAGTSVYYSTVFTYAFYL